MSGKWVEKESRMLSSKSKLVKFETLQALCQHVEPCIIALTFLVRKKYKCHRNEHTRGHLDRNYESLSPRYWIDSKSSITCSLLARYFKWELVVISTILLPSSRTWSPFTTSQVSHFLGICRNVFPPFLLQGWLKVGKAERNKSFSCDLQECVRAFSFTRMIECLWRLGRRKETKVFPVIPYFEW